jgi:DNA repair ATPase RecN
MLTIWRLDPARQGLVEDRLELIQRPRGRYGGSVEAVPVTGVRARQDLQAMEDHESRIADLTKA